MRKCKLAILAIAILLQVQIGADYFFGQTSQAAGITRQETLRGSVTPEREWWDVLHYHLQVEFLPETRRLRGSNTITFKTLKPGNKMQKEDGVRPAILRFFAGRVNTLFLKSQDSRPDPQAWTFRTGDAQMVQLLQNDRSQLTCKAVQAQSAACFQICQNDNYDALFR